MFRKQNKPIDKDKNLLNKWLSCSNIEKFVGLQNSLNAVYKTKVIGVFSLEDSSVSKVFAVAFADAYVENNEKVLLVDGDLYTRPISDFALETEEKSGKSKAIHKLSDGVDYISFSTDSYVSSIYRKGAVQKEIEKQKEKYDHIVVLLPSVVSHKEIALTSELLDVSLMLTFKNKTNLKDVFNINQFFKTANIQNIKTVLIN